MLADTIYHADSFLQQCDTWDLTERRVRQPQGFRWPLPPSHQCNEKGS